MHIITNYRDILTHLSFGSQLTAYLRHKRMISISNYVHIIVIVCLFSAASNDLLMSKVHNYNYTDTA